MDEFWWDPCVRHPIKRAPPKLVLSKDVRHGTIWFCVKCHRNNLSLFVFQYASLADNTSQRTARGYFGGERRYGLQFVAMVFRNRASG